MHQKLPYVAKSFFTSEYFIKEQRKNILLIFANEEDAIKAYKQILFFTHNNTKASDILYFPSSGTLPYDRISANQNILSERANILTLLVTSNNKKLIITNSLNLLIKLPPLDLIAKSSLKLYRNIQLTIQQLVQFLDHNGFTRNSNAIDVGEFAVRGEIIDIVLPGELAYRINFNYGSIESIKRFCIDTQVSTVNQEELIINSSSEIILNLETINNFKDNYLKNFGVNYTNIPLYEAIIAGRKFPGYEQLLPLFYKSLNILTDYLDNPIIIYDSLSLQSIFAHEYSYKNFYQSRLEANKIKQNIFYPVLCPEQICFSSVEIKALLEQDNNIFISYEESSYTYILEKISITAFIENKTIYDKLFETISIYNKKIPVIFCTSKSAVTKLKNIIENYSYQYNEIDKLQDAKIGIINLALVMLEQGFYNEKYLFIPSQDILGETSINSYNLGTKRKLKNILTELDSLNEGELIVHKDHGIGQFINIETLDINGKSHDFLKILYADNDKLYIPVENIEIIKKYGNSEAQLNKLGNSVSWHRNKEKVKKRITETAIQLLQIAAQRKLAVSSPIEINYNQYNQFCNRFHYTETDDQISAVNDIKNDLNSGLLMDRLICGDVGFGKTEVAIRVAFMVAKSISDITPQVAIIIPTTILCKQHYSRFVERFKDLDLNIVQLSSLITNNEAKIVKEQIKSGKANIVIGTHALLSKNVEFLNLKLLIIDEEQHFGVKQKEFLKKIKSSSHVLSLSATPIPRTLQMSMVGLKELSIIATPPMDRLEVHTTIMPFDSIIIRDALLREHFRDGRSFYVVPKIKDIPKVEEYLIRTVPELKYKVAHGKMPPSKVDKIMSEFYEGKFDILVSTTIIESGIDIAEANTMVIYQADMLGLSQLYQLRGRIGRSKIRGYAYLTLTNDKSMTKHAIKRLEIIQNSCSLGSGFMIASHDMDLRGFGNLVGEQQSGQIKEVGVELYQEMLDEQIAILKNECNNEQKSFVPIINLGIAVFIPDNYIPDTNLKLGIYRRVGNLLDDVEIENFRSEMIDRFGSIPLEFNNLLNIVKIKHKCIKLNIENLNFSEQGFILKFYKDADIGDVIMKLISKHPGKIKVRPDNKLIFTQTLLGHDIIKETNQLLEQLLLLSS